MAMLLEFPITSLRSLVLVSAVCLSGCAGVKEAWLGTPSDLHEQLFSQRDKNTESPGLHWFGNIDRADLDSAHIDALWGEAYKLDSIDADTMCIKVMDGDTPNVDRRKAAAAYVARHGQDGWVAGSATTLEAAYPPGTPWPTRTPSAQVNISTSSQTEKEGRWNPDHTNKSQNLIITWTKICVPAPKVTADTHFLTMVELASDTDAINRIMVWQIKG